MDEDLNNDFTRPALFEKMDPAVTGEQARAAAAKVKIHMNAYADRSTVTVMTLNQRFSLKVMVEDELAKEDAPAEYVDGVYVSIGRVNSLDGFLGPRF